MACRSDIATKESKVFFSERINKQYSSQLFWIGDYPDPFGFLPSTLSDGGQNTTGYTPARNTTGLALTRRARSTSDRGWPAIAKPRPSSLRDMPIIPLYHDTGRHLVSPAVQGAVPQPAGISLPTRGCGSRTSEPGSCLAMAERVLFLSPDPAMSASSPAACWVIPVLFVIITGDLLHWCASCGRTVHRGEGIPAEIPAHLEAHYGPGPAARPGNTFATSARSRGVPSGRLSSIPTAAVNEIIASKVSGFARTRCWSLLIAVGLVYPLGIMRRQAQHLPGNYLCSAFGMLGIMRLQFPL